MSLANASNNYATNWYCSICELEILSTHRVIHQTGHDHEQDIMNLIHAPPSMDIIQGSDEDPTPVTSSSMSWTCEMCNETMNIFSRSDHLSSKPHHRQLRKARPATKAHNIVLTQGNPDLCQWECTICEEAMNIFHRGEHLTGREHARRKKERGLTGIDEVDWMMRDNTAGEGNKEDHETIAGNEKSQTGNIHEQAIGRVQETLANTGTTSLSTEIPNATPSSTMNTHPTPTASDWQLYAVQPASGTFNCRICDADFPLEYKHMHLGRAWYCDTCIRWFHVDWREKHVSRHDTRSPTAVTANVTPNYDSSSASSYVPIAVSQDLPPNMPTSRRSRRSRKTAEILLDQPLPTLDEGVTPADTPAAPRGKVVRTFHCTICSKDFPIWFEERHMTPAWECNVCNKTLHLALQTLHLSSKAHRKAATKQQPADASTHDENTIAMEQPQLPASAGSTFLCDVCGSMANDKIMSLDQGTSWKCKICETITHEQPKASHLDGERYNAPESTLDEDQDAGGVTLAQNPEELYHRGNGALESSMPVAVHINTPVATEDGKWYCEVCQKSVSGTQLNNHRGPGRECTDCGCTMHEMWRKGHLKSDPKEPGSATSIEPPPVPKMSTEQEKKSKTNRRSEAKKVRKAASAMIYCESCKKEVKESSAKAHVGPVWECKTCEAMVHMRWKKYHVKSKKHLWLLDHPEDLLTSPDAGVV